MSLLIVCTETPTLPLSAALGAAIVSRRDAADITHLLSLPTTPLSEAVETLYQTIRVLDAQNFKLQFSTWGVLREALVVYRCVIILFIVTMELML